MLQWKLWGDSTAVQNGSLFNVRGALQLYSDFTYIYVPLIGDDLDM